MISERVPIEPMQPVLSIALNTFRESVRDRVLYHLVGFALLLIGASYLLGQLAAGQEVKIIKDLGLAATAILGLFIAIFIGIGLVSKEVERRSVYSVLAKPVRRHEFIAGKYAGLVLTLFVNIAVMTIGLYVVLGYLAWTESEEFRRAWVAPATDPALLLAIGLIFVELMVMTAVALFFSTFTSAVLAAVCTFGIYITGHLSTELRELERAVDSPIAGHLWRGVYYVLPDLTVFDIKAAIVHAQPIPLSYMVATLLYGVGYIAVLLLAAMFIFARRDFQ